MASVRKTYMICGFYGDTFVYKKAVVEDMADFIALKSILLIFCGAIYRI